MGTQGKKLEREQLAATWVEFKERGDLEARNALVLHYTSLVRVVAIKIAAGLPRMIDREDLISYGFFGLLDAIEKFDLEKNIRFETYAVTRIRGSIFDEIRALDWVPRGVRAKARDLESAESQLHARLGRPPEDLEIAEHLGVTLVELWALQTQTENSQMASFYNDFGGEEGGETRQHMDPTSDPADLYVTQEVVDLLADAIESMPQRSKTILALYYLQEMTLAEIGEVLGVTESRVCQLQSKLLQTLHGALSQGVMAA